jgi:hypothetical protein
MNNSIGNRIKAWRGKRLYRISSKAGSAKTNHLSLASDWIKYEARIVFAGSMIHNVTRTRANKTKKEEKY